MHPWFVVNNSRYSPSTFPCQHTCPPSKSSKNKNCTGKWWNSTHIAAPYTTPVPIPKDNVLPSFLLHAKLSCKKAYVTDLKWRLASTSQLQVHLWWPSSTRIPTLGTVKGKTIWIVCALCFAVSFRSSRRLHKIFGRRSSVWIMPIPVHVIRYANDAQSGWLCSGFPRTTFCRVTNPWSARRRRFGTT